MPDNLLEALRETYGELEVHEIPAPNEVALLVGALVKEANAVAKRQVQENVDGADAPPPQQETQKNPEDVPPPTPPDQTGGA